MDARPCPSVELAAITMNMLARYDIMARPFDDGYLDTVSCSMVLHAIDEQVRLMSKCG